MSDVVPGFELIEQTALVWESARAAFLIQNSKPTKASVNLSDVVEKWDGC